jgi:hypothetical protein
MTKPLFLLHWQQSMEIAYLTSKNQKYISFIDNSTSDCHILLSLALSQACSTHFQLSSLNWDILDSLQ